MIIWVKFVGFICLLLSAFGLSNELSWPLFLIFLVSLIIVISPVDVKK